MMFIHKTTFLLLFVVIFVTCNKHNITIKNDGRKFIPLSTFGFFQGGRLLVDIVNFNFSLPNDESPDNKFLTQNFGFTLQKTRSDGLASFVEKRSKGCALNDKEVLKVDDLTLIKFRFNLLNDKSQKPRMDVEVVAPKDEEFRNITIKDVLEEGGQSLTIKDWININANLAQHQLLKKTCTVENPDGDRKRLNMSYNNQYHYFSGAFAVILNCESQAGFYNLYFHNCGNYEQQESILMNLNLKIIEENPGTYLSAGQIPLPVLYFFMSAVFFGTAVLWTVFLRKRSQWTFKIHWLMAMVVYLKALSLLTHGLSFHFTGTNGIHVGSWAILFYIIHLFKGALLFATIVLIGTGYFFIKHVLSSKEKKLFCVVIPLQIVANVTQTIMDSAEEGDSMYSYYYRIALAVDLICCGAILLPVIWSIKHLSEAAKTDGKAAISLRKLKLFRQFYIMIVCYIYFTRIIVQLMRVTVPFQMMWLCELFSEVASFFFFVLTGWKFRPFNDNPYLHLPQEEDDEEMEMNDISTYSGYGERLTRVNTQKT